MSTLAEAGDTKHPGGLTITTGPVTTRWQITGQLAPGEKHNDPEFPVEGEAFHAWTDPESSDHEGLLAMVLAQAKSPEIHDVERWSTRAEGKSKQGLTIIFHNGARVFVRKL
ncbi:hypothetical protein ACFXI8_26340 [Streptomyces niveus]|uniref:hypothetical protein n=1 Tax=Streptomyces niveus TaxID=193462 RepID=UPI00368B3D4B